MFVAVVLGSRKETRRIGTVLGTVDGRTWCTIDLVNRICTIAGAPPALGTALETVNGDDWVTHAGEPVESQ